MTQRQVIHVDMDAFFAAVEQRDNPDLLGKPVIIGGLPDQRGVVSTASYEARKYGIHSAMPMAEAYRRCPQGIFLRPNMAKYLEASKEVLQILYNFSPIVEIVSIDEAFLDVTGCERALGSAEEIGWNIKKQIAKRLRLTASVGISYNKFLAKLASDLDKPDGFLVIAPEKALSVLDGLLVNKIWGVGSKTESKLSFLGIKTIKQLRELPLDLLQKHFGEAHGYRLFQLSRGIDERPVETDREVKSMAREVTFPRDTRDRHYLESMLLGMADVLSFRLRAAGLKGRTLCLKLRFDDFQTLTRNYSLSEPSDFDMVIYETAKRMLNSTWDGKRLVRLLGLGISSLSPADTAQLTIFDEEEQEQRSLARTLDAIRSKYGFGAIVRAGAYRLIKDSKRENDG
ncbi:MAG: DNA polymerase IV [Clostridia bacterium]|nr:DNA polymerase IV [Clostridia bacterium]